MAADPARLPPPEALRDAIRHAVERRGAGRTLCPSEVARSLAPEHWRELMAAVRREAAALSAEGRVTVTRRGVPVDATAPGGPIRLGLPTSRAPGS